jgi:hypothetical protein
MMIATSAWPSIAALPTALSQSSVRYIDIRLIRICRAISADLSPNSAGSTHQSRQKSLNRLGASIVLPVGARIARMRSSRAGLSA